MNKLIVTLAVFIFFSCSPSKKEITKPRILISTDIGGTDPDDNQSMIHFLMYSNMFQTEGLISSPSYGEGSKEEIFNKGNNYSRFTNECKYNKNLPLLYLQE